MPIYLDIVIFLNFLVDYLLLLGADRLAGYPASPGRSALAAGLGGIYGGACLLPGFRFLGNTLWRAVSLGLMGVIAFGVERSALRRCVLFVLLSMALGGIALGLGSGSFLSLAGAAAAVCGLCAIGFRGKAGAQKFVPVLLKFGEKQVKLTALHDTGNTLRDPHTGESVLIAGAEAAQTLLGLDRQQLLRPVETVASGVVPGLRLLPYRAVGQESGMLAAVRIREGKIGGKQRSVMVAFAPTGLGDGCEALIGGVL